MHLRDERLVQPGLERCDLARREGSSKGRARHVGRRHLPRLRAGRRIRAVDHRDDDLKALGRRLFGARRSVGARRDPVVPMVEAALRPSSRRINHMASVASRAAARLHEERQDIFLEAHRRREIAAIRAGARPLAAGAICSRGAAGRGDASRARSAAGRRLSFRPPRLALRRLPWRSSRPNPVRRPVAPPDAPVDETAAPPVPAGGGAPVELLDPPCPPSPLPRVPPGWSPPLPLDPPGLPPVDEASGCPMVALAHPTRAGGEQQSPKRQPERRTGDSLICEPVATLAPPGRPFLTGIAGIGN